MSSNNIYDLIVFFVLGFPISLQFAGQKDMHVSKDENQKSEISNVVIANKYKIGVKIGGGSFGEIYHAQNILTGEDLAVKVEHSRNNQPSQLKREAKVYRLLQFEG